MKKLYISYNDLSTVDPGLLASAVNRLEEVEMSTVWSIEQVEAILRQSLVKTSLKKLGMWGSVEDTELDEDLVARARLAIEELYGLY